MRDRLNVLVFQEVFCQEAFWVFLPRHHHRHRYHHRRLHRHLRRHRLRRSPTRGEEM